MGRPRGRTTTGTGEGTQVRGGSPEIRGEPCAPSAQGAGSGARRWGAQRSPPPAGCPHPLGHGHVHGHSLPRAFLDDKVHVVILEHGDDLDLHGRGAQAPRVFQRRSAPLPPGGGFPLQAPAGLREGGVRKGARSPLRRLPGAPVRERTPQAPTRPAGGDASTPRRRRRRPCGHTARSALRPRPRYDATARGRPSR